MKKILILITLLIFIFNCKSQGLIGYSENEIQMHFYPKTLKLGYTGDGLRYLKLETKSFTNLFYMNTEKDECVVSLLFANTNNDLMSMIKEFNNKFIVVSSEEWKSYTSNGVVSIFLINREGSYHFMIMKAVD